MYWIHLEFNINLAELVDFQWSQWITMNSMRIKLNWQISSEFNELQFYIEFYMNSLEFIYEF